MARTIREILNDLEKVEKNSDKEFDLVWELEYATRAVEKPPAFWVRREEIIRRPLRSTGQPRLIASISRGLQRLSASPMLAMTSQKKSGYRVPNFTNL